MAKEIGKKELQMAQALIDSMSDEWKPEEYVDEYREALEKLIEEKVEKGDEALPKTVRKPKATNVIDLVSVLQKSLQQSGGAKKGKRKAPAKKIHRKAA